MRSIEPHGAYSNTNKTRLLIAASLLVTACPLTQSRHGIRACDPVDAAIENDTNGYVRSTALDGAVVCIPFSQPTPPMHCPYVVRHGDYFYLYNYPPNEPHIWPIPGCPDVFAPFQRPCSEVTLRYSGYQVGDVYSDTKHVHHYSTAELTGNYALYGIPQVSWRAISGPGCPEPNPESNGDTVTTTLNRTPSPTLNPGQECFIDHDNTLGIVNQDGVCLPFAGQRCDSGYSTTSHYIGDGACVPYWGTECDAGTTIDSHYASDGACVPNPGERCDAGRGDVGTLLEDGACVRRDASVRDATMD